MQFLVGAYRFRRRRLSDMFKNLTCRRLDRKAMIKVSDKETLNVLLQQNRRVLTLFCASWCPFCRSFLSVFDKRIAEYSFDSIVRAYVDDDDNPLWEDYSIEAVPSVILFEQARVVRRLDAELGAGLSEKQFAEWLANL